MSRKPLREAMPTVAAWIDELREAFGRETVDAAIRNGVNGGSHFHASENGQQIGSEGGGGGHVVSVAEMVLGRPEGKDL